ncbi:hypothetical protein WMY93_012098 [Mugilogobius chulae]|uniref:DDB1- and CUL4-associated factor 1 n=1 Tax=Mugilogobius chulae TaxID=88201 RepID=A0AAW0P7X6_9GOBI
MKLIQQIAQARQTAKRISDHSSEMSANNSFLSWFGLGTPDQNHTFNGTEPEESGECLKKTHDLLDKALEFLCQIFKLNQGQLTQLISNLGSCEEDANTKQLPDCIQGENGLILTDVGRMQIINGLRKFDIQYQGDPELQPIRSYENAALVRLFYRLSTAINERFGAHMNALCSRSDLLGRLGRHYLTDPQSYTRIRHSPVTQRTLDRPRSHGGLRRGGSEALSAVLSSALASAVSSAMAVALADDAEELVSVLTKMSEVIEQETREYYKRDPDPFDDRHPGRADPNCMLGRLLKTIFANEDLTNAVLDTYILNSTELSLNTAACRLLQNMVPGLETSAVFEDKVPLMLSRLRDLQSDEANSQTSQSNSLPQDSKVQQPPQARHLQTDNPLRKTLLTAAVERLTAQTHYRPEEETEQSTSGSSWSEMSSMVIGSEYSLSPLTPAMEQRLILQYLTPLGDYQELLAVFMQMETRTLLMKYIDLKKTKNVQLTFDALLVPETVGDPRPSYGSHWSSLCLYYLAYNQDAMERVCMLQDGVLSEVVSTLCGYWSRLIPLEFATPPCFSPFLLFRAVLQLFDQKTVCDASLTDDQMFSCGQKAKHTSMALRRYFEAHLAVKVEQVKQQTSDIAYTYSREQVVEMIEFLMESGPLCFTGSLWKSFINCPASDVVRYVLDILAILTVVPKVQLVLAETVDVEDENRLPVATVGMSIILGLAESEAFINDAEIQKSALQVIINCVCAPDQSHSGGVFPIVPAVPLHSASPHNRNLARMWHVVQNNNGIKVLLSLLSVKIPITGADSIRTLACKALVGLSRSSAVRQIISKLPLFSSGQIQQLMNEPVLQDKRSEHVRFCRYASELTERISGKPLLMGTDVSLSRMQRANVVAQSRITFPEKELLVLIRNHLMSKGLHDTANLLVKEANLTLLNTTPTATPTSACPALLRTPRLPQEAHTPAMKKQFERHLPSPPTLDGIITEYLREQHAHCPNPVATCPPFSLFAPHRCPEPKQRRQASPNFTARLGGRVLYPKYRGVDRGSLDRQLIFSRFRPISVFHEGPGDESDFTCCAFSARERFLMLGTCSGHLKFFNVFTGEEAANYTCHTSAITHLEPSRDGKLLLTSASSWSVPLSALWSLDGVFNLKSSFVDDNYVEFSKLSQDRIIGTHDHVANIYDIQTGQKITSLNDPALANNYKRNCATFNPSDDLVLNDGVLWDVRATRAIHKFDKFNTNISGVFHPSALEVIINTEIWDLRTFHLLHTVPALDQCRLVFNSNASIIYGAMLQADDDDDFIGQQMKSPFGSSFRTFDATDYKPITTVDVKSNIFDLCTDSKDCYLAVIENQDGLGLDTVCRLYEVGRQKLAEEGDDEEDEEQDADDSSDSDDDDDDDDMDTDPLIEELAGDDNPENDEQPGTPTEDEIARLLGYDEDDEEGGGRRRQEENEEGNSDTSNDDSNDNSDYNPEQSTSEEDDVYSWL